MQSLSRAVLACLLVLFAGISACVTTSEDSGIKDLAADTKLHPVVQTGHFSAVTSVAFSLDGQYALSGSRDHTLKLWNVLSGREIRTFKGHTDVVSSVSYTPDGRFAVSASWDKTVKMWDVGFSRRPLCCIRQCRPIRHRLALARRGSVQGFQRSPVQIPDMGPG